MNKTRSQAADYLGIAVKTLDNWRSSGRGPRYLKMGARVVYPVTELDTFRERCLRGPSPEPRAA